MKSLFFALFSIGVFTAFLSMKPDTLWQNRTSFSYTIDPESKLFLEGSSNVVDFTCHCTSSLQGGRGSMVEEQGNGFSFVNSILQLPVQALDCGNRTMNKDMYEALAADKHPFVEIQLLSVKAHDHQLFGECHEWEDLQARLRLKIAGETREMVMHVRGTHLGYQRYRFVGAKPIYLTHFNIEPPRAMLGAIRVDDCIKINMDLVLVLSAD
ncbi:YceI family protein [Lewinella sp. LCG006]|uniref:YceI family protein n=1 Tax=Lewinella sp. LCG006 TaxID=3231911 RepID=UPI003460FA4D